MAASKGDSSSMIPRCPNCGTQVSEQAAVCPACAWDFSAKGASRKAAASGTKAGPASQGVAPRQRLPQEPFRFFGRVLREEGEEESGGRGRLRALAGWLVDGAIALVLAGAVMFLFVCFQPGLLGAVRSTLASLFPAQRAPLEPARLLAAARAVVPEPPDSRDPRRIRRAAIDPYRPEAGPLELAPGTVPVGAR